MTLEERLAAIGDAHRTAPSLLETGCGCPPSDDSVAAQEARLGLRSPDNTPWPAEVFNHLILFADLHLRRAAHICAAFGSLVSRGEVFYALPALVRAQVEQLAQLNWVLEGLTRSPTEAATRSRHARVALVEITSTAEIIHAERHLGVPDERINELTQMFEKFVEQASIFGEVRRPPLSERLPNRNQFKVAGEQGKGATELVESMAARFNLGTPGRGLYAFLSALTHPKGWVMTDGPQQDPGGDGGIIVETMPFIESLSQLSLVSLYQAMCLCWDFFAYDRIGFPEWEELIARAHPGIWR